MIPNVIAVFDVGKTNKKLLLFDEQYHLVEEQSIQFNQTIDEDGDSCEDLAQLSGWIKDSIQRVAQSNSFKLKAINVAAYGASFVHLNSSGEPVTPLYDYLKPYPSNLIEEFYNSVGGKDAFCRQTASPPLESLNSGLQLYRIRKLLPSVFTQVHYSLHLPQYLAWLVNRLPVSEITSIGCHTGLWDFEAKKYHPWVAKEGIVDKLPEMQSSDEVVSVSLNNQTVLSGIGLHDSSSALIPYLSQFSEAFVLLSTGTWNITLNPFNDSPLTAEQLAKDCLCYLDFRGNPVKAARLFAGHEHENKIDRFAEHFHVSRDYYKTVQFDRTILTKIRNSDSEQFETYTEAYHRLIDDLMAKQLMSTNLVLGKKGKMKRIFVDGGFSSNPVFMNLLASVFPDLEVFAASVPHATALGAAVVIHKHWNIANEPPELIKLVRYFNR